MTVHGDDLVLTIRAALKDERYSAQAPTQSGVRIHANEEQGWLNRDGRLEFDCVHRDWTRAYRITVEAVPMEDFTGEMGDDEWTTMPASPSEQ